jgi:hypothetical protein
LNQFRRVRSILAVVSVVSHLKLEEVVIYENRYTENAPRRKAKEDWIENPEALTVRRQSLMDWLLVRWSASRAMKGIKALKPAHIPIQRRHPQSTIT